MSGLDLGTKYLKRKILDEVELADSIECEALRKRVKALKQYIETLEGVASASTDLALCNQCGNFISDEEYAEIPECYKCKKMGACETWCHGEGFKECTHCERSYCEDHCAKCYYCDHTFCKFMCLYSHCSHDAYACEECVQKWNGHGEGPHCECVSYINCNVWN